MTEPKFFAVSPKTDCPHLASYELNDLSRFDHVPIDAPCFECKEGKENWICVKCGTVGCSGYQKGHMKMHAEKEKHGLALSFSDLSFWCYDCDSYITGNELRKLLRKYQDIKFPPSGKSPTKAVVESMSKLNIAMEHPAPAPQVGTTVPVPEPMKVEEKKLEPKLTLEELAKRIKSGAYKKIVALTGAGISVNAGIPDFRSPGTGLYNQLEKLNLPFPEAVFTLEYFKENPEPFFQVAKEMFGKKYVPTKAHYFLRLLEQKGLLIRNYTQNIDNLEADAGMAADKLIQAHGTYASAHCVGCKMAVDGKAMVESIREGKPKYCEKCKSPCKPDIVFFGESLPDRFFDKVAEVKHDCDFLMIMGSTLQVMPFNMLPLMVGPEVPRLVINNELPELFAEDARNGDVYMAGDSDASITKLVALLGWNEELAKLMAERAELAKKYGVELKS